MTHPIVETVLRLLGDKPEIEPWQYLWLIDAGHGRWQSGKRSPKFSHPVTKTQVRIEEWWINMVVVRHMIEYLKDHGVACVEVNQMPEHRGQWLRGPGNRVDRMNLLAEQSKLPVRGFSQHFNAAPTKEFMVTKGIEAYYYPGSKEGELLARITVDTVAKEMGLPIRRQVGDNGIIPRHNFKVLSDTNFPIIINEGPFFTDYETCRDMLSSPAWLKSYAIACGKAIVNYEISKR